MSTTAAPAATALSEKDAQQIINTHLPRHRKLSEERIRLSTQAEQANRQLAELRQKAQAEFGTDKPEEILEIIAKRERANAERVSGWVNSLNEVEGALNEASKVLAPRA